MERKTMPNQAELQEEVVLGDRDELLLFRVNYSVIQLPSSSLFFTYKNLKFFIFRIIQPYLDKGG